MRNPVAALVILYNYDDQCIENIKTYMNDVDVVYAYDNSTVKNQDNEKLLKSLNKISFIDGGGNNGLPYAINYVAKLAIRKGYQWLITFDQDSVADKDMIPRMREFIETYPQIDEVGLIGPSIHNKAYIFDEVKTPFTFCNWIIQSGAMHNLEILKKVKGYDTRLFIDQVDIEYCIRMKYYQYKVITVNHAILIHNTMDEKVDIMYRHGRKMFLNKYSSMRYYYIMRNNLYCKKKYKKIDDQYVIQLKRNITTLLLNFLYDDKKWEHTKAILYGYIDYIMNKMGKTERKL
jgi:rhamnosyltransferase